MKDIHVPLNPFERFSDVIDRKQFASYLDTARELRQRFEGRIVWNINTTDAGGGVAEMLRSLIAYVRGFGIDSRWVVMEADDDFFRLTKRLHHALHGSVGDGTPLDEEARRIYDAAIQANARRVAARGCDRATSCWCTTPNRPVSPNI